jgi:hypothetical protein
MLTKPQKKLFKLNVKAQKATTHAKATKILAKHKKLSPLNDH